MTLRRYRSPLALCYNSLKAEGTAFSGREPELFSSLLNKLFVSLPGFGLWAA